jgi:hypothetical protein
VNISINMPLKPIKHGEKWIAWWKLGTPSLTESDGRGIIDGLVRTSDTVFEIIAKVFPCATFFAHKEKDTIIGIIV